MILDSELTRLLLSLTLLLFSALGVGYIFSTLGLPRVIGEICAGILLGPSFFGYFAPGLQAWIFSGFPEQTKVLSLFYWMGLILLMFTAGFKVSTNFDKKNRLLLLMLIAGGLTLPGLLGFVTSSLVPNSVAPNQLAFSLIIAIAAAVTSIPILTRIFFELEILDSSFAQVVLTAAAIQDLILWVLLSFALSIQLGQPGKFDEMSIVWEIILGTIIYSAFLLLIVPSMLRILGPTLVFRSPEGSLIGYTMLFCLTLVSLASIFHINVIFGALLAGLIIGRFSNSRLELVKQDITNISTWFFVPVYFALIGLQINLPANFNLELIFGFLFISSVIKVISVVLFVKLAGISWAKSFDFGVTMNARGGPGIVLASIAYTASIIDEALFVALVMASILTSLMSGQWLRWRRASIITA